MNVTCSRSRRVGVIVMDESTDLGYKGQEIQVKPGFARNYLVPKKIVVYASPENVKQFKVEMAVSGLRLLSSFTRHHKQPEEAAEFEKQRELNKLRTRLEGRTLSFVRAANDAGHLYGSVNARDIVEMLQNSPNAAVKITEADVQFDSEEAAIHILGSHTVRVRASPDVWVPLAVEVATA